MGGGSAWVGDDAGADRDGVRQGEVGHDALMDEVRRLKAEVTFASTLATLSELASLYASVAAPDSARALRPSATGDPIRA
jgi:hypothetical protein